MRIASYNIHACRGWDGRQDVARVAAVLREIDADVIGLQEVESRHGRSTIDQAEALGEALGMACIEGPLLHGDRGWYGNALLTRRPARAVRRVLFEDYGREARGAIIADLAAVEGVGWRVLTTHLDLHHRRRRRQFECLLDEILPATTVPTVVIGDFNEWWPFSRGLGALRRHSVLPFAPATFPTRCPLLALDRIALSGCRLRGRVRRHITPLSRVASDHLPIWAEVVASPAVEPTSPAARVEDAVPEEAAPRRQR
ncbi:MAG TPA: endonuclease/exonuclease/phosphatase family protein, partial [Geminicoccaceae bacterium]|nr:endonuclease/exonuclease/phosphatase family protein [Geminicoccaceae bacterium]